MVFDSIVHLGRYDALIGEEKASAIHAFLSAHDMAALPDGHYEILGRDLFVNVQTYEPKDPAEARCEMHRQYIDLQYVIRGSEKMGCRPRRAGEDPEEAKPEGDIWFFEKGDASDLAVTEGMFALFLAGELHAPGIADGKSGLVKKAVFKISV